MVSNERLEIFGAMVETFSVEKYDDIIKGVFIISRREFLSKMFKAIIGSALLLPYTPKTIYSFPTDIELPDLYYVNPYDGSNCILKNIAYKHPSIGPIRIFPNRLCKIEMVKLLRKLEVYDGYTSWHFVEAGASPNTAKAIIWWRNDGNL